MSRNIRAWGAVVAAVAVAGCSSSDGDAGRPRGDCPTEPVAVVVSVAQWGDVVRQLGGDCADVTTIVEGGDVDPHEFEPSPADSAAFGDADLVVVNGLDYDHWAEDAVDRLSSAPPVVVAGEVAGLQEGANPHVWYDPEAVQAVSAAVTSQLTALAPVASGYLSDRASAWRDALRPYLDEIARVEAVAAGRPYGATESVFEYMADAVGLVDETPTGYRDAAAAESDPSPGDINAFQEALRDGAMAVLVHNTQTEGSVPRQLRDVAEGAGVPVVEVSESVPPGVDGFVAWQVGQLQALAAALGG